MLFSSTQNEINMIVEMHAQHVFCLKSTKKLSYGCLGGWSGVVQLHMCYIISVLLDCQVYLIRHFLCEKGPKDLCNFPTGCDFFHLWKDRSSEEGMLWFYVLSKYHFSVDNVWCLRLNSIEINVFIFRTKPISVTTFKIFG